MGAAPRDRPIRVALVDDHQFIADLLSRALERQPDRFVFADGILTKQTGIDEILAAIERADRGDVLLDPEILRDLMTQPAGGATRLAALDRLTPRERVALEAVLSTGTTSEAAKRIGKAPATPRRAPAPRQPEARHDEPAGNHQRRAPCRAHPRASGSSARANTRIATRMTHRRLTRRDGGPTPESPRTRRSGRISACRPTTSRLA